MVEYSPLFPFPARVSPIIFVQGRVYVPPLCRIASVTGFFHGFRVCDGAYIYGAC